MRKPPSEYQITQFDPLTIRILTCRKPLCLVPYPGRDGCRGDTKTDVTCVCWSLPSVGDDEGSSHNFCGICTTYRHASLLNLSAGCTTAAVVLGRSNNRDVKDVGSLKTTWKNSKPLVPWDQCCRHRKNILARKMDEILRKKRRNFSSL